MEIQLSPNASWDANGITVAGWQNGTGGSSFFQLNMPIGVSISTDDVLYISDVINHRIVVVHLDLISPSFVIGSGPGSTPSEFHSPYNSFLTKSSLYVLDMGNARIQKLSLNGSNPSTILNFDASFSGQYFYFDNETNIYLASMWHHTVFFVRANTTNVSIVAGTGVNGSSDNELYRPYGLFVTSTKSIYIADCFNHRVMRWDPGATTGIRVAGNGSPGSAATQLNSPTQVIMDSDEYLYISESDNVRITRWAPNSTFGVCIAACTGIPGTAVNQLNGPHSLALDSYGSLYVSDYGNNRVQKFQILNYRSEYMIVWYNDNFKEKKMMFILGPSYNQPKFSSCTTWHLDAITFVNISTIGTQPYGLFVDTNNSIYFADYGHSLVQVWLEGSTHPIRNITAGLLYPRSIFVTSTGDIYVDNGAVYDRVDKWTSNTSTSTIAMRVNDTCYGLFVDTLENVYCSMNLFHSVVKRPFDSNVNTSIAVAGNGTAGSTSNMLHGPRGIFVSINFSLYVADCYNNRIQLFQLGNLNGTTVAGVGTSGAILLQCPTGVVLDADGYLFIADSQYNRIIASNQDGFQCILGCTTLAGSTTNSLEQPWTISFDSYVNLFVTDMMNTRIQKFLLSVRSCSESNL